MTHPQFQNTFKMPGIPLQQIGTLTTGLSMEELLAVPGVPTPTLVVAYIVDQVPAILQDEYLIEQLRLACALPFHQLATGLRIIRSILIAADNDAYELLRMELDQVIDKLSRYSAITTGYLSAISPNIQYQD